MRKGATAGVDDFGASRASARLGWIVACALGLAWTGSGAAWAQTQPDPQTPPSSAPAPDPAAPAEPSPATTAPDVARGGVDEDGQAPLTAVWAEDLALTHHEIVIDDLTIPYTATAGTMALNEEDGTHKADLFFIAYTRDGIEDLADRPIAFTFNGGPGSSSVWLHLGAFGPRRVLMSDDPAVPVRPPFEMVDNAHSILDVTDLVFIDPITTGYSRPAKDVRGSEFHGVSEDVQWVGEFIRLYTTRFERWASPKFLSGESYGTTRAAALSGHLQSRHGMYLNGIVLVSSILNFQTTGFDTGNDLPYSLFLPTFAATAWYHRRLASDLQDMELRAFLDQVETFAAGPYTLALMKGDALTEAERAAMAERVARYCGLSREFVEQCNLRVSIWRFTKELLREQRRTVGRLDSRYQGIDADAAGESTEYDPSYAAIQGPYAAALNHYVRAELRYENDLPYEILTGRVRPWNYGNDATNQYLDVAGTLRSAMSVNPHLRVFVANGYYDLATPYFATQYTVSHLGLDPALRDHITMRYYEAGHMMYVLEPALAALRADIAVFVREATPPE